MEDDDFYAWAKLLFVLILLLLLIFLPGLFGSDSKSNASFSALSENSAKVETSTKVGLWKWTT